MGAKGPVQVLGTALASSVSTDCCTYMEENRTMVLQNVGIMNLRSDDLTTRISYTPPMLTLHLSDDDDVYDYSGERL